MNLIRYTTALLFASQATFAISAPQLSGKFTQETAQFTESGTSQGATSAHAKDSFKKESSLRLYIDDDISSLQNGSYHVELQAFSDMDAITSFADGEAYTQRDPIREAYVDATFGENGDVSTRVGKQQVVWGKADGMKLLDIINPTDYSEMAQNQMEDSRIPVFMMNVEKVLDEGGTLQLVVSQPRENYFPGLNRDIDTSKRTNGAVTGGYTSSSGTWGLTGGAADALKSWASSSNFSQWNDNTASTSHDQGQPFILKGVDTITGGVNGFVNVVPDLGTVASLFSRAFNIQGTHTEKGLGLDMHGGKHWGFTVGGFNSSASLAAFSTQFNSGTIAALTSSSAALSDSAGGLITSNYGFEGTNFGLTGFWRDGNGNLADYTVDYFSTSTAQSGAGATWSGADTLGAFAGKFNTNLQKDADVTTSSGLSSGAATSAVDSTFEFMDRTSFATFDAFVNATSEYKFDMPSDTDMNLSFRHNDTTKNGINYSLVYSYNYDPNPVVNIGWVNSSGVSVNSYRTALGSSSLSDTAAFYTTDHDGSNYTGGKTAVILLKDAAGNRYGGEAGDYATLRFNQTLERAHNLGGAFDMTLDTESMGPVVIRGEGLYQKDVYSPVIDRGALAIGDIDDALKMLPGDKFKYVLGVDITALTNMMVSAQFIQERNLDYIDNNVDYDGAACSALTSNNAENCGVYTADFASMNMTNGMKKGLKNKEFYSLFLSKPFGASDQHRWNNIYMIEEGGGRWNRLDAEFAISDNIIATGEWNRYWGNDDSQFGQLKDSSNLQLGVKYTF